MDAEQAKARKTKADLTVTIGLLDEQAMAIRESLHRLKVEIAAGQIALDRGEVEFEKLRQHAVETGDPGDAADVLEFRGAVANFRGKIAEMRESLVGSAMLIPIIGQTKQAAETRLMKISNGMLVVIPRLMAVASQAVVHVQLKHAADEAAKLDEASRQISLLAPKARTKRRPRRPRALPATRATSKCSRRSRTRRSRPCTKSSTSNRQVAAGDREREARLTEVRDKLIRGMQGVNQHAIEQAPRA